MPTAVALTTVFAPSPSCLSDVYQVSTKTATSGSGEATFYRLGPAPTSDCFPAGWNSATTAFFSPGVCPQGYAQACSSTDARASETVVTCCPSGYGCLSTGAFFSGQICSSQVVSAGQYTITTTFANGGAGGTQLSLGTRDGFNAYGVVYHYKSGDITSAASTQATIIGQTQPSTTPPPTTTPSVTPAPESSGISVGAKVGIAVAVVAAVLFALALGFFIFRRRRAQRPQQVQSAYDLLPVKGSQEQVMKPGHDPVPHYTPPAPPVQDHPVELPAQGQ